MTLSGKNEENKSMKKAKRCLIAVVSGVLVATAVLSGCGQSKKEVSKNDDHLTVYLWENRLMKNIAPYIHEQLQIEGNKITLNSSEKEIEDDIFRLIAGCYLIYYLHYFMELP